MDQQRMITEPVHFPHVSSLACFSALLFSFPGDSLTGFWSRGVVFGARRSTAWQTASRGTRCRSELLPNESLPTQHAQHRLFQLTHFVVFALSISIDCSIEPPASVGYGGLVRSPPSNFTPVRFVLLSNEGCN